MKKEIELIEKVIDLLSDESRWMTGALAFSNETKKFVHPKDPTAECFCLIGAIAKNCDLPEEASLENFPEVISGGSDFYRTIYELPEVLKLGEFIQDQEFLLGADYSSSEFVYQFNDSREHAEVLNLLKFYKKHLES